MDWLMSTQNNFLCYVLDSKNRRWGLFVDTTKEGRQYNLVGQVGSGFEIKDDAWITLDADMIDAVAGKIISDKLAKQND